MLCTLHALSRYCRARRAACSRLSEKTELWRCALPLSRAPRVSLQLGNQQAMASADRVAEAARMAIFEARVFDAQVRMLASGPWVADVHDKLQSVFCSAVCHGYCLRLRCALREC